MSLMQEMNQRALGLGVPLSVQLDVTYRCNERCVHCYLDHDDHGEMTTAEIQGHARPAGRGGCFLPDLQRRRAIDAHGLLRDLEYARELRFSVKLKTNAFLIREKEADRLRDAGGGVRCRSASIRTGRKCTTPSPSCRARSSASVAGIRLLRSHGVKVIIANVLMRRTARLPRRSRSWRWNWERITRSIPRSRP